MNEPDIYKEFTRVLHEYKEGTIKIQEVESKIKLLLANHRELFESFKHFLTKMQDDTDEEESFDEDPRLKKKSIKLETRMYAISYEELLPPDIADPILAQEELFFQKLKKVLDLNSPHGMDYYTEFLGCLDLFMDCVIIKKELFGMLEPLFLVSNPLHFLTQANSAFIDTVDPEDPELINVVQKVLNEYFDGLKVLCVNKEVNRRKLGWYFKNLIAFRNAKTPKHGYSYHTFHKPVIIRDGPDPYSEILNRQWISVPLGSEDFSFKLMRKNVYEDGLFKCEDERYDYDMIIESTSYTLNFMEKELQNISQLSHEEAINYKLSTKVFTPMRLKPVATVYGDYSKEMITQLMNNPAKTLPVVIQRLASKLRTWKFGSRPDYERGWKDVIDKNFYKSLDHKSFIFTFNEKRLFTSKNFIAEAKYRYSQRLASKVKMYHFLEGQSSDHNYEFLGGAKNLHFFSSFENLSTGQNFKVPSDFLEEISQDFLAISPSSEPNPYENSEEQGILPHFRIYFCFNSVIYDAIRLVFYSLDKISSITKDKTYKFFSGIFTDLLNLSLSPEILSQNIEDFYITLSTDITPVPPAAEPEDLAQKMCKKWLDNSSYSELDPENHYAFDPTSDIQNLKGSEYTRFIPVQGSHVVKYASSAVYTFLRFFYAVYERLLKVKRILAKLADTEEIDESAFNESVLSEYRNFLKTVCMTIKGTYDNARFEERCRYILGKDAYFLFTFDKLLSSTAKSIQAIISDDLTLKLDSLFQKYKRTRNLEEMYYAEAVHTCPTLNSPPVIRLLWSENSKSLYITYFETPYEKLGDITPHKKYYDRYTITTRKEMLNSELQPFISKIASMYSANEEELEVRNGLQLGICSTNMKIFFIPRTEDSFFNTKFHRGNIYASSSDENIYIFRDKNSLIQKTIEISEMRFQDWRNRWLAQQSKGKL
jgi:histone deacetylase complex regulatory component SIN3